MTDWTRVQGSAEPQLWDETSSPTTVYQHANIVHVDAVPAQGDEPEKGEYWEYDERKFTVAEYEARNAGIDEFTEELIEGGLL